MVRLQMLLEQQNKGGVRPNVSLFVASMRMHTLTPHTHTHTHTHIVVTYT